MISKTEYVLRCLKSNIEVSISDIDAALHELEKSKDPVCWVRLDKDEHVYCLVRKKEYDDYVHKQSLTPLYKRY